MEEIFIFQARFFKSGYLLGVWKLAINAQFQHKISKILPARPEKHRDMRCKYYYSKHVLIIPSDG